MSNKKITLKDIARQAGVSQTSVSIILNNKSTVQIAEKTKRKVLKIAHELGYTVPRAHGMEAIRHTILYIYEKIHSSNIVTSFFSKVAFELKQQSKEKDLYVLEVEYKPGDPISSLMGLLEQNPKAIVTYSRSFLKLYHEYELNVPCVLLQGDLREAEMIFNLIVDDFSVGTLAADELYSKGYVKCGIVFPHIKGRCAQERHAGFVQRFEQLGGTSTLIMVKDSFGTNNSDLFTIEKILQQNALDFDSFYFFADAWAIAGLRGIRKAGFQVPQQIGIIGTDNLYWTSHTYPSISTMDLHEIVFADRIIDEISKTTINRSSCFIGGTIRIPVSLISRESTHK